jgi:hypothetical protein
MINLLLNVCMQRTEEAVVGTAGGLRISGDNLSLIRPKLGVLLTNLNSNFGAKAEATITVRK